MCDVLAIWVVLKRFLTLEDEDAGLTAEVVVEPPLQLTPEIGNPISEVPRYAGLVVERIELLAESPVEVVRSDFALTLHERGRQNCKGQ
jgi:hypothetical protein